MELVSYIEAILWGLAGGAGFGWGSREGARAICSGKRTFAPILGKIIVIGCLFFGIRRNPSLWPYVFGAMVLGAAVMIGFALLARRKRLR